MSKIIINQDQVKESQKLVELCPFNAIEFDGKALSINAGCKMCKICTRKEPTIFEFVEEKVQQIDKDKWVGIAVVIEYLNNEIHPVSLELLGKARVMADKINHPVHAVVLAQDTTLACSTLLKYDIDTIFSYQHDALKDFKIEPYTAVLEDYINNNKPSIVLVGGTNIGRSLAPRVAARFKTGLTADCTILDVSENSDLDQIRPAFGGNIMAHIYTPNHRPQFATVRYKIFDTPTPIDNPVAKIEHCDVSKIDFSSAIQVLEVREKEKTESIEDAEIIVVAGAAIKNEVGVNLVKELAELLQAKVACTRPLIENGMMDARLQIGLSGRTVRPKLIITCGVSGAIQFVAGMNGSETIIAINNDPKATIFDVAHIGLVGDVYEIIPSLINTIKQNQTLVSKETA